MEKKYIDMTNAGCTAVFVAGEKEIINAGTTIYSMSIKDKNEEYDLFAEKYDVHFIFDDNIPDMKFYSIPWVDIFAVDSEGGYIGTVGETSGFDSSSTICYIDKEKRCYEVASNFADFIEGIEQWKDRLKKCDSITLLASKEEALAKYDFINLENIMNEGLK